MLDCLASNTSPAWLQYVCVLLPYCISSPLVAVPAPHQGHSLLFLLLFFLFPLSSFFPFASNRGVRDSSALTLALPLYLEIQIIIIM